LESDDRQQREEDAQEKCEDDAPENGAALLGLRKRRCGEANGDGVVARQRKIDEDDLNQRRELSNIEFHGGAAPSPVKRLLSAKPAKPVKPQATSPARHMALRGG
jgi:hypothetical protein